MMDLTRYDIEQLRTLCEEINKEINERQKEQYKKDYENALNGIRVMAEKYPYEGHFDFGDYNYDWRDIYAELERGW